MIPLNDALRFYGVVDANDGHGGYVDTTLGVDGVSLVRFRDLGAVVGPAEYVRMKPGDAELKEYLRVVDGLFVHGPIVPAPPGTVFRDADVLLHWLELHYAKLHEALGMIERRAADHPPYDFVQMELRA